MSESDYALNISHRFCLRRRGRPHMSTYAEVDTSDNGIAASGGRHRTLTDQRRVRLGLRLGSFGGASDSNCSAFDREGAHEMDEAGGDGRIGAGPSTCRSFTLRSRQHPQSYWLAGNYHQTLSARLNKASADR